MSENYNKKLQQLMQQVNISSFRQLSIAAGVSEWQLRQLRQGKVKQMRLEILLKLSVTLQLSLNELIQLFSPDSFSEKSDSTTNLKQEYSRLQSKFNQQQETLQQEFQRSSLQLLESWLLQWPTAAYAAQKNPQLPAVRLLALVKPIEKLLQQWGVETIASVGEEIPYNPKQHQLMTGTAQPGDIVRVRYVGYRQGDKLLYKAKVSVK